MTLADLLTLCHRHRWWALSATLVVSAGVLIGALMRTPLYEATAALVVDRGRKAVEFRGSDPDDGRVEFSLLNTYRDQLLSPPVLGRAVQEGGLATLPAYAAAVDPVGVLQSRVAVTTSRDSWVITVTLRDEEPQRAVQALQALINGFIDQQAVFQREKAGDALAFLSQQVSDARQRLEDSRNREQEFRSSRGILSVDPERNQIAQTLSNLVQQRGDIDRQLADASALETEIRRTLAGVTDPQAQVDALLRIEKINQHPVVVKQQQALFELLPQQAVLEQRYKAQHPRMIEFTERLTSERKQLADAVGIARASVATQVEQVRAAQAVIDARIATQQRELATYRDALIRLSALSDETASRERIYQQLLSRLNEEEVSSRLEARQLAIITPPRAQSGPVNIRKPLAAAAALVAGLVAGLGTALLAETLDRRVRGAAMARLISGLPVIGRIPRVRGSAAPGGDGAEDPALKEGFRALRTALLLARPTTPGRALVLAVTSAIPLDGKSTVCAHLALSLARAGRTVLLIDADLRRPALHTLLAVPAGDGLARQLAGGVVEPVTVQQLAVLTAGEPPDNPAELLLSPRLAALIADARTHYDAVVIDTPPLGVVTDALVVGELADAMVLVARDARTPKTALRQTAARLQPLAGKVLGVVFNAEHERDGSEYEYYYGPDRRPQQDD